jgi:gamma-glutamylcyclotransferase (GGCT)/AIG2-like uncharacterized protein YtfP
MKVAVYGSLRKGCHNHRIMQFAGGKLLETVTLKGIAIYDHGVGFPFAKFKKSSSCIAEIYEVPEDGIERLDKLEGYDEKRDSKHNMYVRSEVPGTDYVIYIYNRRIDSSFHQVDHGDWVKFLRERN